MHGRSIYRNGCCQFEPITTVLGAPIDRRSVAGADSLVADRQGSGKSVERADHAAAALVEHMRVDHGGGQRPSAPAEPLHGADVVAAFEQMVAKEWRLCLDRHRRHYSEFRTMPINWRASTFDAPRSNGFRAEPACLSA